MGYLALVSIVILAFLAIHASISWQHTRRLVPRPEDWLTVVCDNETCSVQDIYVRKQGELGQELDLNVCEQDLDTLVKQGLLKLTMETLPGSRYEMRYYALTAPS